MKCPYYNPYYIFERDNNLNIIDVVHIIYSWFMVFTLNHKIIPVIDFYRSNIHIIYLSYYGIWAVDIQFYVTFGQTQLSFLFS